MSGWRRNLLPWLAFLCLLAGAVAPAFAATKILYPYDNGNLTRTPQPATNTTGAVIASKGGVKNYTLVPAITAARPLSLTAGTITVTLVSSSASSATLNASLWNGTTQIGVVSADQASTTTVTARNYTIALASTYNLSSGSLVLRVTNSTSGANKDATVYQYSGSRSQVSFATSTVINIDSLGVYAAQYPSTATATSYAPANSVFIRATISDPFGAADVSAATLALTNPLGVVKVGPVQSINEVLAAATATSKTFEFEYPLPSNAVAGTWNASVTGLEGTEGTVNSVLATTFTVATPALTISKSHSGDFTAGSNGSYAIVVHNGGGSSISGTTTVSDAMPSGLSFVSGSGTGWSCGGPGATATCTSTSAIAAGADYPTLNLTVAVAGSAGTSVNNVASVSNPSANGGVAVNSNTDATTIRHPDLSTSTDLVADQDGGDADPGDVLRYTINLVESAGAAASGVSVVSTIPAGVTGFNVISLPGGATNASTGSQLNVTGISIPASGSASIVYEVTVSGSAVVGDTIDATATVTNPNGTGASLQAPTVTVLQSQVASGGNKLLYLYDNLALTRTPQPTTTSGGITVNAGTTRTWTMSPAIPTGQSLVLTGGGTIAVNLASDTAFNTVTIQARLFDGATQVGSMATKTFSSGTVTNQLFSIALASDYTLLPGHQLTLQLTNTAGGNKNLTVYQYNGGRSTIGFATSTVVSVESVAVYAAAYPATTTKAFYAANEVMYVRTVVSDPFGSGDVGGADLTVTDANGAPQVNAAPMTQVNDSGVDRRTYEYAVTLPANAVTGFWTTSVTGHEGTEGTVTDVMNGSFGVGVAQLTLAKSHTGNFTAGANGTYNLVVHNNGSPITATTTVIDTLPTGLSFVSYSGSGWTCTPAGQVVTCTNGTDLGTGADLATLALTVAVAGSVGSSVANLATISNPDVDSGTPQNSNSDATTVLHPDLSTSTHLVADQDGGDADPGDVLRYTVIVTESAGAAASGVRVSANIPANVTGFNVVDAAGGTNASVIGGGVNSTGFLDITGISVPASGTASIVYEVTVAGSAVAGDPIDNTATIDNPNGTGASVAAPTVTVLQSQVAASGNKLLYVYENLSLTRTPQPTTPSTGISVNSGTTRTWTLAPAIPTGQSLVLSAGTIAVKLAVNTNFNQLNIQVRLLDGATPIGTTATQNFTSTGVQLQPFSITLASDYTLVAGRQLTLEVTNTTGGNKNLTLYQYNGSPSTIQFATSTVVAVQSVAAYGAAYPATTTQAYYLHEQVVRIRSVVSDPFGSADVGGAEISITDPNGATVIATTPMTEVADSGVDTRTYEYAFQVPMQAEIGTWTASITAHEGTEGTVTHTGNTGFDVRGKIEFDHAWVNANAGDAVTLAISGGVDAVAGSSTAPSTTTAATAAAIAGAGITLAESFTTGLPGDYTANMTCSKNSDDSALVVAGSGLSRTFTMPTDSSVTCAWTNTKSVPLTVVKLSMVYSDPVNGTTNPKAIPGAVVEYQVIVTNTSSLAVDSGTIFLSDVLDPNLAFQVTDIDGPGSGPVKFTPGTSGLVYTFTSLASTTDDVEFSSDGGSTWTHPASDTGGGVDAAVDAIRINPGGVFNGGGAQFTAVFRVRIK